MNDHMYHEREIAHMLGLILTFGFILTLILIVRHYRDKASQRWHETARTAIEKGQPLPAGFDPASCGGWGRWGRRSPQGYLRRGLVLIAIGAAVHLAGWSGHNGWDFRGDWSIILLSLGAANLILALFARNDTPPGGGPGLPGGQDPSGGSLRG